MTSLTTCYARHRLVPPTRGAGDGDTAKPNEYNAMRSESVNKMKYNLFERKVRGPTNIEII